MNDRIKKFYENDGNQLFQYLKGLPEKIVEFESMTGESLPDEFDYAFVEAMNVNDLVIVIGRIGFIYIIAVEKANQISYELQDSRQSFILWSEDFIRRIVDANKNQELSEEEKQNLKTNIQLFREKIHQIPKEDE